MKQHTPGPWRTTPPFRYGNRNWHITQDVGVGEVIIAKTLYQGDGETDDEQEANARLIAAAPELLKAAKRACTQIANGSGAQAINTLSEVINTAEDFSLKTAIKATK